jgi:hypothetical protein
VNRNAARRPAIIRLCPDDVLRRPQHVVYNQMTDVAHPVHRAAVGKRADSGDLISCQDNRKGRTMTAGKRG